MRAQEEVESESESGRERRNNCKILSKSSDLISGALRIGCLNEAQTEYVCVSECACVCFSSCFF